VNETARHSGWTLEIMRYIVFERMPRNAPASLSATDRAAVMAYLLAANCYRPRLLGAQRARVRGFGRCGFF
jgi:hypothetical protein